MSKLEMSNNLSMTIKKGEKLWKKRKMVMFYRWLL